ncbi:chromosome partitioning protein ParA [Microbacterium testaceum]|uniref:Chromosome partitioning protein ParA n=1 Tax=Microbacterium testaceum TaxID=2033 RepID=A0A4Y3QNR6_MICTE|nr:phage portal protein [Microbacterium testaceum]GEB46934.1 chromosome partitioning protein ParA [Microbacterium testaceum]
MDVTATLAEELDGKLEADLKPDGRLGLTKRYLEGAHDEPYMPRGAKAEFKHLAKRAVTNWLPLVPDTFAKDLFVEGYRAPKAPEDDPAWKRWQENGLDARQTIAHRGALEYGTSYVLVLKAKDRPSSAFIRPLSPLRSAAWYADEDDEFPQVAIRRLGKTPDGKGRLLEVYEGGRMVPFTVRDGVYTAGEEQLTGFDHVPFVRFRDRLDGASVGLVRPLIPLQDRVNETVFSTLIAMQYASFRQRWATGLAIPVDEDPDSPTFGEPLETFESAVNRLWVSDSSDARFGDFAQTELSGHHEAYKSTVRTLAALGQISPDVLMGELINVSGDALTNMQHATRRKRSELETLFGESWESVFRLAAIASGSTIPGEEAQVRWRDAGGENLAATVDALGKMAQMLGVPQEALWERVPGVTDTDLKRWKELAKPDALDALTAEINRQAASAEAQLAAASAGSPPTIAEA